MELNSYLFKRMESSTFLHVTRRCRIFNLDAREVKTRIELRFLVDMLAWKKLEFHFIKTVNDPFTFFCDVR